MRLLVLLLSLVGCTAAPPAPAPTVDVVTLNLWNDQADWPARLGVIADTLGALRPDVIVLQEVLQDSAKGLANQAETLGARLGTVVAELPAARAALFDGVERMRADAMEAGVLVAEALADRIAAAGA